MSSKAFTFCSVVMIWVNCLQLETARTYITGASGILVSFDDVIHFFIHFKVLITGGTSEGHEEAVGTHRLQSKILAQDTHNMKQEGLISEECLTISSLTQRYCLKYCDECQVFNIYVSLDIFWGLRIAASNGCNKLGFILLQVMETRGSL
jgi:hypothetical protein